MREPLIVTQPEIGRDARELGQNPALLSTVLTPEEVASSLPLLPQFQPIACGHMRAEYQANQVHMEVGADVPRSS